MDWIRGRQHKIQVCRTNREVTYKTINTARSNKCYRIGTGGVVYCAYAKRTCFVIWY